MKLLLDTHFLIWAAGDPERLPKTARESMSDPDNELFFSVASLWEVAIKASTRRNDIQADAIVMRRAFLDNRYTELPITGEHVLAVSTLPAIHKDPFDRILIAQAMVEGITLLTNDSKVAKYPGPIRLIRSST